MDSVNQAGPLPECIAQEFLRGPFAFCPELGRQWTPVCYTYNCITSIIGTSKGGHPNFGKPHFSSLASSSLRRLRTPGVTRTFLQHLNTVFRHSFNEAFMSLRKVRFFATHAWKLPEVALLQSCSLGGSKEMENAHAILSSYVPTYCPGLGGVAQVRGLGFLVYIPALDPPLSRPITQTSVVHKLSKPLSGSSD